MQRSSGLWRYNILLFTIFLLVINSNLKAQQIPNLTEIKIDELSDDQIIQFIKQSDESGYSEAQLEVMARARGMSDADISKLRRRVDELRNKPESRSESSTIERLRSTGENTFSREEFEFDRRTSFDPFSLIFPVDTMIVEELEIFGLSFFKNSTNSFEPSLNVATPANYLLGPGDQVILDVWGASEQSYALDISPQGSILIPNIGPVYLNGYTLDKAEKRIIYRLKSIYSTLGQNTFAQVSLGQLRTIRVNVVGEVEQPGSYPLSGFASVMNALQAAGGPSEQGSFREIKVFRFGELVATEDLYEVLSIGGGLNFKLQDQDVVMVPPYLNRITIDGEVKRPAIYEMRHGEPLSSVLNYAGGFSENAYRKSVSLRRNLDNVKTVRTVEHTQFEKFEVKSGDIIAISRIQNRFVGRVRVEGAVNHPGEFEISEGMLLSEAIELSEGFRGDAFMERAIIIRELPSLELKSIAFAPKLVVKGIFDLELKQDDLIKVQSIFDLREEYKLNLQGEVQEPGEYPYAEGMTIEDLILLGGGFLQSASRSFVEVARRIQDNNSENQSLDVAQIFNFPINESLVLNEEGSNFILMPFDVVVIRKSPVYEEQTVVEIEGEVVFPGKYVLKTRDERVSDVLKRSGGLTDFAYAKGATLIRRTEYFVDPSDEDNADNTSAAAKIKKSELQDLFEKDTSLVTDNEKFKMQESIGIQLDKIIQKPGGDYDLILKEGDVLSIPRQLQTVRVRGEVLYPSTVKYKEGSSLRYFVGQAGGFSDRANRRKSYVIYANGSAQKTGNIFWFKNYPEVEPGAELVIPARPDRRRLSAGEVTSLAIALATLGNIIISLVP